MTQNNINHTVTICCGSKIPYKQRNSSDKIFQGLRYYVSGIGQRSDLSLGKDHSFSYRYTIKHLFNTKEGSYGGNEEQKWYIAYRQHIANNVQQSFW